MKHSAFKLIGEQPSVQVLNAQQRDLENRLKALLLNRTIERVTLYGEQIVINLDNGAEFSMTAESGFVDVN